MCFCAARPHPLWRRWRKKEESGPNIRFSYRDGRKDCQFSPILTRLTSYRRVAALVPLPILKRFDSCFAAQFPCHFSRDLPLHRFVLVSPYAVKHCLHEGVESLEA